MKIFIKYMVSFRCKMIVKMELDKLGIIYGSVDLGEVELKQELTNEEFTQLKMALLQTGLELMESKRAILIEKIKKVVIEMVYGDIEVLKIKKSDYISKELNYDNKYQVVFKEVTNY